MDFAIGKHCHHYEKISVKTGYCKRMFVTLDDGKRAHMKCDGEKFCIIGYFKNITHKA